MTGYKSLKKETNYFCLQVCLFRKDYGFPSRLKVKQPDDLIPNWLPLVMSTQSTRDPRWGAGAAGAEELQTDADCNDTAERTLRQTEGQANAKTNSDYADALKNPHGTVCLVCLRKQLEIMHDNTPMIRRISYPPRFLVNPPKTWRVFFSFFWLDSVSI